MRLLTLRAIWFGLVVAGLVALHATPVPAQSSGYYNQDTTTPLITLTAAGAGTTNSADQFNGFGKGLQLGVNISAKSGTISLVVNVQGKDASSGVYYNLCSTAALTGTGFTQMTVYPGTTAATNTDCNVPLPATWRVQAVNGTGSTPSVTATIGASIIE
jgi:hypothetical protein